MNILEVNYSDTYLKKVEANITVFFVLKKIIQSINYTVRQLIKDLIFVTKNKNFNNKVICFANSVNQKNALVSLKGRINNLIFAGLPKESVNRIPMGIGCIISIILSPVFLYDFVKFKNKREKILCFFESYFFIRGMYLWWVVYLKLQTPKAIIMSNDHLVWHRVLKMAAQKNSIPVVYIQHASVTEKFPKLEFDLSLLEGRDALSKYMKRGISGKVELVGMMKFDQYHKSINKTTSVNTIGFCTNLLDQEEKIYEFVTELHNKLGNKSLILRPHPRDERHELYNRLIEELGIELSNSKSENSFEFLQKVEVNIAAESNIHLEAVLLNVYPIYLKLKDEIADHYGFINKGMIVDVFEEVTKLTDKIHELSNDRPYIRNKAKYYVDTVDEEFDGKSVEKVIQELEKNGIIS
jgi:hypothetical protein